nr:MAG TPA: hypothetical protein [Caudoviricetes sp.]DAL02678.1 MAG TPA: hypothetical protein [Caudoviricetes sp.]
MGGNGSSGGVKAGGGVKIPELTGTEKQVAWAKDILTNPHASMLATAKLQRERAKKYDKQSTTGRGGDASRAEAEACEAAAKRYQKEVSGLPKSMKAKDIIDKRYGIETLANAIVSDEYKKRKLTGAPKFRT